MQVEVVAAVLRQPAPGAANGCQRADVRARAALVRGQFDTQRGEDFGDLRGGRTRAGRIRRAGIEGIDAPGTEVTLGGDDLAFQLAGAGAVGGIDLATPQPLFLVGESDYPDRAFGRHRQPADQMPGGHGDGHPGTVIDRAGAQVPGIQVATDHHHFLRALAAGDLADHIVRGVLPVPATIQRQGQLHRAALQQPAELVGIGHGQRGGRDRGQALIEAGDAGMRHPVRVGAGRAHHKADRTLADCLRRPLGAHRAARAIATAVAGGKHPVIDKGDLAGQRAGRCGLQRGQVGKAHHLGLDLPARAAAQRGDLQWLGKGAHHPGRFTAPLPLGEGHRLGPDPVKAELDELFLGPGHRARIGLAAGHARADLGGQRLDHLPAGAVGQGLLAQLHSGLDRRRWNEGLRLCARTGQQRRNRNRQNTHGTT